MSGPHFHRNHAQHISKSEKLSEELKKTGQDILLQINNLNQKTSDQLLIKVINGIVGGICSVIPDLQEIVIKSSHEHENNAALKDMLKKLSQYCNEMVQGYDNDSSTLKIKFQTFIKNILLDTESLLNIIKKDNLHDFKYELVESLKEILCTIHIGQAKMEIESYNKEELKTLIANKHKEFFENISQVEKCSLAVLKDITLNIKYSAKHTLKLAYYLNKVASNYDDIDIQRKILNAASSLNSVNTTGLLQCEKITDIKAAVDLLKQCFIQGSNTINDLFDFNDVDFENNKHAENLRDIIKTAISYGIVLTNILGGYVNHDCGFALIY